jgi:hypothetical protein
VTSKDEVGVIAAFEVESKVVSLSGHGADAAGAACCRIGDEPVES